MPRAIFVRHGESIWNKANLFTGWTDVGLTPVGEKQATEAGKILKESKMTIDHAFTSVLVRATETLRLLLEAADIRDVPITKSWILNERHYGALQGLNKSETAQKYGEEQVFTWRRSYDIQPPALEPSDERHPANDLLYKDVPKEQLPATEALSDVVARVAPYWEEQIAPSLKDGKTVLVAAHGNTIRAIVKHLDDLSNEEITRRNIPYATPLVYDFDDEMKVVKSDYLGDAEAIAATMQAIAKQGAAK